MKRYYEHFFSVTEDLVKELDSTAQEEHISLQEKFLSSMAVRIMMLCLLGPYFKNDSKIKEYKISFYACWREMEERLDEGITPEEGSQRDIQFKEHLATMRKIATEGIEERRNLKVPVDEKILTDVMLDSGYDEDVLYADILAALLGGIHTSGLLLTWSLYFMAKYPEIQEKVYQELNEVLGEETITPVVINQLVYTKQVLNETLRYAVIAPYNARVSEVDLKIGEHVVPRQTPIITALGVVHQDTEIWSEPERFNPDRFDPKEMKKKHPLTFEAFGIGKRKCPGYRFTYTEIIVVLSILLRRFKFNLVEGQQIGRIYGLISHPDKDIYVTVSQR